MLAKRRVALGTALSERASMFPSAGGDGLSYSGKADPGVGQDANGNGASGADGKDATSGGDAGSISIYAGQIVGTFSFNVSGSMTNRRGSWLLYPSVYGSVD